AAAVEADAGPFSALGPILVTEREDVGDRGGLDVNHRNGIGLLKRGIGGAVVGRDLDPFGLEILRGRGARAEDAYAGGAQLVLAAVERRKAGSADIVLADVRGAGRKIDDADRALGVDRIVLAWLALVDHQHPASVGREGQRVGQGADFHHREAVAVGVVKRDRAVVGGVLGLNGDRDYAIADRDAVGVGANV